MLQHLAGGAMLMLKQVGYWFLIRPPALLVVVAGIVLGQLFVRLGRGLLCGARSFADGVDRLSPGSPSRKRGR